MIRRILKWSAISLGGLIAVLLVINAIIVWRSGAALEQRLEAIRAAGEPLRIQDLAREPIAPEENAAVHLRRAAADLKAMNKDLAAFYESEAYKNESLGRAELKMLEDAIQAYPDAVALVEQAVACPDYDPQLDYSVSSDVFMSNGLDHMGDNRQAIRLLNYRTMVLLAHGQRDEALQSAVDILRLARHYQKEPAVVGYLVALACEGIGVNAANQVIRSGPIADAARDALNDELARHDVTRSYRRALVSERAFGLTRFNELNLGQLWPARGFWNNTVVYYLDVMASQLDQEDQPYDGDPNAVLEGVSRPFSPWSILVDLLAPAIDRTREATERNRTTLRCLRILNAVTRREQDGVEVTGLADLELSQPDMTDPFTGDPLLMKKLAEGWVIYSVGTNLKDDGGQLDTDADIGVGPVTPLPSLE